MTSWGEPLRIIARTGACLGLALWLTACAGIATRQASNEERAEFEAAIALSTTNRGEATTQLESFIKARPESVLADDAALKLADWALADGDDMRAMEWLRFIDHEYPSSENADVARVRLAALEMKHDEPVSARRLLSRVDCRRLDPDLRRQAYRMLFELTGEHVDRLGWLVREREVVAEDLAAAPPLPTDPETGAELAPDQLPPDTPALVYAAELEEIDREIAGLLEVMTDLELEQAIDRLDERIPSGRAWLVLAMRAVDRRDFDLAVERFDEAGGLELTQGDRSLYDQVALSIEMREQLEREGPLIPTFEEVAERRPLRVDGAVGTIGVVLPLTGRFSQYGEESLRGVMLAADLFSPDPPSAEERTAARVKAAEPSPAMSDSSPGDAPSFDSLLTRLEGGDAALPDRLRILIRDSRGTPEGAERAVEELAQRDDVLAIVGPLLGGTADASADVAEEFEVPLLTLTSRQGVTHDRSYVFRTRTTPNDEIRSLVDYAWDVLEARRFAVLYPKDRYGRRMRDVYWQEIEQHGGKLVASAGYEPNATDFAEPIRRMIGYSLLTEREKEALEHREELLRRGRLLDAEDAAVARRVGYAIQGPEGEPLPPNVDFDALFVPDSHDRIVLIAPQLTFHEVLDVDLLGPGDWNHPDLVAIGRDHVNHAVISALFHRESRFDFVKEFVDRYESTYGAEPDVFSAHSYDATRLVLARLAAGDMTRENLRSSIVRTEGFPGASGVMNVMPDGNAIKRPFMLQVQGSRIVPLD